MATSIAYAHDSSLVARNRRRGVALSCAECRRLKLKCSRIFPCSNCVKKGCSAICPEGSLTTGKGNRFVLANTEVLHDKIGQLCNRVRELEDALTESHAANSNYPHPLLSQELLQIKRPLERERLDAPAPKDEKSDANEGIDSIGSLYISQRGHATFFGQAANSWYLLQHEEGSEEEDRPVNESPTPQDVPWFHHAFPFTPPVSKTAPSVRATIIGFLPRAPLARKLSDIYFRHAAWMYTPIPETDFYEHIFRPMYEQDAAFSGSLSSHSLAVLCMVFALGTLLDLEKPAQSPESIQFYQLGRAAMALDPILEQQSIPGIQALLLMCHFMFLLDMSEPRWIIMGMITKLALSIGLHRDSGRWNLDPNETQKRRELFYELLTYDSWQSLTFGRPPSLAMAHVDTKLPHDTVKNAAGEVEMSFSAWKHRFSSQCLSVVHDQAFGARNPNYKVIQELDRKVRTYYVPPSLQVPGFGGAKLSAELEQASVELTMQRYIAFAIKEITLFYMHRGFFAQAMEDNPSDPMGSKYAPSVLAAYSSACSFVGLIESLFKQHPTLTERMWFLFTHVFSCSIVLGSIAVKSQMALAPSALSHLECAYSLFSKVSDKARTGKILPVLQRLRDRAHAALSGSYHSQGEPNTRPFTGPNIKSEVEELSTLGGLKRLVSRRSPSSPSFSSASPSSQPPSSPAPPTAMPQSPQENQSFTEAASAWQSFNSGTALHQSYVNSFQMQQPQSPASPQQQHPTQLDAPMMYSNGQHAMPLDLMSGYYDYNQQGGYVQMMHSPDVSTPPQQYMLPIDSWQHFVAQYNK